VKKNCEKARLTTDMIRTSVEQAKGNEITAVLGSALYGRARDHRAGFCSAAPWGQEAVFSMSRVLPTLPVSLRRTILGRHRLEMSALLVPCL